MRQHLAILKKEYLNMFIAGQKAIELRLTKSPCAPYNQIAVNEKIFLKISAGPVCATAKVKKLIQFCDLTPAQIRQIKVLYDKEIHASEQYWSEKLDSKFAVLVWLDKIETIRPITINKKDQRAWLVLTQNNNFGLYKTAQK